MHVTINPEPTLQVDYTPSLSQQETIALSHTTHQDLITPESLDIVPEIVEEEKEKEKASNSHNNQPLRKKQSPHDNIGAVEPSLISIDPLNVTDCSQVVLESVALPKNQKFAKPLFNDRVVSSGG